MNHKAIAALVLAAGIAFARPVAFVAQETGKAAEILAAARKAIGDKKLDALKTFSVQSALQRNIQSVQVSSEVEILLELPDKYLRSEASSGGGVVMMAGGNVSGFNGDRPLQRLNGGAMPGAGGGMGIRTGGSPGSFSIGSGEQPSPEQLAGMSKMRARSSQSEASRLMLGWFAMAHPALNAQYTYAGEAESPDGKAYVIDVKNADNFAARLFIDEQTHLPLMVTYKGPQPRMMTQAAGGRQATAMGGSGHVLTMSPSMTGEERKKAQAEMEKQIQEPQKQVPVMVDYTVFFDDWRDADGVKFPFKMRRAMGSETTEEWTVSKVKVNPKIDPKRFAGES
ncbi:MAG TPA: hypothetical protein VF921_03005 [Vicinamibacterales bacterium]